jgi:hypothetical protein
MRQEGEVIGRVMNVQVSWRAERDRTRPLRGWTSITSRHCHRRLHHDRHLNGSAIPHARDCAVVELEPGD